jgi:hypothetical protein
MQGAWFASLGAIAAGLQLLGYLIYTRYFLKHTIRPNAASWFMFAYGTAFLTYLEFHEGASTNLLMLPVACAIMSVAVALLCLKRNATEPVDRFEKIIFSTDVWLTIMYGALAFGWGQQYLSASVSSLFLIAVNLTSLTCFLPIVRSTWLEPDRELPWPWLTWAAAYACLGAATLQSTGFSQPTLLLYPFVNFALHALVGVFALRAGSLDRTYIGDDRSVYLAQSGIHGRGVFAGVGYSPGDVIWTMTGRPVFQSRADGEPNYVGVGLNFWIDPDKPIDTMNHNCAPNAAFSRNAQLVALDIIHAHDEITFDYSTTEADPHWEMACACGAETCRQKLYAIQYAFANAEVAPAASPTMQQVWSAYRRNALSRPAFPQFGREPAVEETQANTDNLAPVRRAANQDR